MYNYFDSPDELNNLNLDLTNYYYFEEYFNDNEINKILKISEKYETVDGEVSKNIDKSYRTSNIKWLPENKETEWIYDDLKVLVKKANEKMWNFDLIGLGENIQIGEYSYEDNGHYDWHLDIGEKCNFRKISVSVQLSDPKDYDGGDLQFYTNRNIRGYLGYYEDFVLTALSLQNNNTGFIDKSQVEKKDLLAQFLDITVFEELYRALDCRLVF